MKKILSFLTLLLLTCSMMWATTPRIWDLQKTYSGDTEAGLTGSNTVWVYSSNVYTYQPAPSNAALTQNDGTNWSGTSGLTFSSVAKKIQLGKGYLCLSASDGGSVTIPTIADQYVNILLGVSDASKDINVTGGSITSFPAHGFTTKAFSINIKATGTSMTISYAKKWYIYQIAVIDEADVVAPAEPSPAEGTYYKGLSVTLSSETEGTVIKFSNQSSAKGFADLTTYESATSFGSTGNRVLTTCATKAITEGTLYSDSKFYAYIIEELPTPTVDVAANTFTSAQSISFTNSLLSNGVIKYTLDGSSPTWSSTEYDGNPIVLYETKTLKANVFETTGEGAKKSSTFSGTYTINIPALTGAWSAASGVIYTGDAVPTPSFSVTNDPAPSASAYNVVYSLKAGSDDGVVSIGAGGASFTLNNDVVGEATIIASLTSADLVNYKDAESTYEYSFEVRDRSPWIALTEDEVTLKSTPLTRSASKTVTLTGGFLTNGTYNVSTSATGLSISPVSFTIASGEVSQEFTVTYNPGDVTVAANSEVISFSDGTTSTNLTVNYSSVVTKTQRTVSAGETWDWSKATGSNVNLDDKSTPAKDADADIVAANFDGNTYVYDCGFPDNFDAIVMYKFQRPKNGSYYQGQTIKIKTSVPGAITVTFANTGSKRPNRYLSINGTIYGEGSGDGSSATQRTVTVPVEAGDITLTGIYEPTEANYSAANGYAAYDVNLAGKAQYLNYYKIVFTPTAITLGANGYSTFAAPFKYTVSGATVYKAAYDEQQNAIVLTEVENAVVPANAGIILKGTEGATVTITPSNATASTFSNNQLVGVLAPTEAEANWYVLATDLDHDGLTKFHACQADITIPANKAYMVIGEATAPAVRIIFAENGATDIKSIEDSEKAVKFIENGKLYIQKDGVVYDATGAKVK